jgi:hypothetical protein
LKVTGERNRIFSGIRGSGSVPNCHGSGTLKGIMADGSSASLLGGNEVNKPHLVNSKTISRFAMKKLNLSVVAVFETNGELIKIRIRIRVITR